MSILNRKVLQLTAHYEPDGLVEVWHAITLVHGRGAAQVEEYSDGLFVHSASRAYKVPSVIRLVEYHNVRKRREGSRKQRLRIFQRDDFRCQYCGRKFSFKDVADLTLDHIIPRSRGGHETDPQNLATSCDTCNQRKGNRTPDEARMPLIAKPSALRYGLDRALLLQHVKDRPEWADYLFLKERAA